MPNESPLTSPGAPTTTYELLTQLTTGPSSREVASSALRSALRELYPRLNIDPDLAMVVTPRWQIDGDDILPARPYAESLTTVLARQAVKAAPVIYIDGEHYLTHHPEASPAVHLPVQIDAIARLINELSPLLFSAFQEQQLDYWNAPDGAAKPRWQVFASSLRNVWNIKALEDWDSDDCAMARNFCRYPERVAREAKDPYKSRAYLIDIDLKRDQQSMHIGVLDMAVLIGTHKQRPVILTYSLVNGYEKYSSLTQLGAALPASVSQTHPDMTLQWRLYEPAGNFFDHMACALIAMQIEALGDLAVANNDAPARHELAPATVVRVLPSVDDLSEHALSSIRDTHQRLPDWLADASDEEAAAYSRYLIDLSEVHAHNHGRSFRDDIAPIRDYVSTQLQSAFAAHAKGAKLNLDKVEVVIESPRIWGNFMVPGVDVTRRNLIDLTLENLTGLPTGQASVLYSRRPAPEWLTFDYLKSVIAQLDIGKHYPALIKRTLLDDPLQSANRQALYTSHLRVQLPLLALQLKIRAELAVDELGYRYVAAVLQTGSARQVDGQVIVIRPLAFIPGLRPGPAQDVVANMFVIGPRDSASGPCLLYRPLLEPTLIQFASRQNLLYSIKHDRPLRESVLAWLPKAAQFNYAQYVFRDPVPSPWVGVQFLVEPATVLYMSGPINLGDEELKGDVMATLFKANAMAMVELADSESISNTEKRWQTLRQTGWQIFNAALPFLGRTVGVAAWIWQIMDDLQEAEHLLVKPDDDTAWTALVDLWLNLGMALALHVALRHPLPEDVTETLAIKDLPEPVKPHEVAAPIVTLQLPDIPNEEVLAQHQSTLHVSGALSLSLSTLLTRLDAFKLDKPEGLGEQNKTPGSHMNLFPLADKWYAPVGKRWFEVTLDANDNVVIVDPANSSRTGPLLTGNLAGQWFVDTRLRLRGGGLRNRRLSARGEKSTRITQLRKNLTEFDTTERALQLKLVDTQAAIGSEPGPATSERRESFIRDINARLEEYDAPIRHLRALNVIDAVPNYQSAMIGYLKKQLLLTRTAVEERLKPYRDTLLDTLAILDEPAIQITERQIQGAADMSTLNLEMIKRMEYTEAKFKELEVLGLEATRVIQETTKAMPPLTLMDLKALQLMLGRYLCVKNGDTDLLLQARSRLNDIVEAADVNVQSLLLSLHKPVESQVDEHIDLLNSLVEQLTVCDERLLDLHADFPEAVLKGPLQDLRVLVQTFSQRASRDMAVLLRERRAQEPRPGPSGTAATVTRKTIKTRFHGTVVGETRESQADLVDVKAPMTGKVIATFHEKTPGVWVERETTPGGAQAPVDLDTSINAGLTLLDEEPATARRILAHSKKAGRIPVEIEEMFHQQAARLDRAQATIETALTQLNLTPTDRPASANLMRNLNDAAKRLFELGKTTRISMTKQQPPTAARVQWLHSQGLVNIVKAATRRRLKGPGRNYLDEYQVCDHQTFAVLWYAHFHYASPAAAVTDYFAGHLKTREQQKLGGAFQRTGTSDKDQIAIYRSEISMPLAKSVFFGL